MSLAYIPVLTAAVSNARKEGTGLSSGLVNTRYKIGSALCLATKRPPYPSPLQRNPSTTSQ
jgi:hypothetical protein